MFKNFLSFVFIVTFLFVNMNMLLATDNIQNKPVAKRIFSRELVTAVLKSIDAGMIKGDDKGHKLSYIFYRTYANKIRGWFKNPWMELDTMIAKSWYINLYNTFIRMAKIKRNLEQMELQHKEKTAVYKFEREKFLAQYKIFKALQAKPTKLTKRHYRELVKAKKAWEKQERIKARALARAKKGHRS